MKKKDMSDRARIKQLLLNGAAVSSMRNWGFATSIVLDVQVEIVKDRSKAEESKIDLSNKTVGDIKFKTIKSKV